MAVKRCCIETCQSSAIRPEDVGVTFHKFPKNLLRERWRSVTQFKKNIDSQTYVCSRHFCKNDFRLYDDSKYILKSDATPSIFSWTIDKKTDTKMDSDIFNDNPEEQVNTSSSSKDSEIENVEAIQKFIECQEKEINETVENDKKPESKDESHGSETQNDKIDVFHQQEPISISTVATMSTSIINMILSETETKLTPTEDVKPLSKQSITPGDKVNSVALTVGSEVEAKDYAGIWHPAKILEVDYDEMEVLVHYADALCRPDEWINVSSTRLRPISAKPLNDTVGTVASPPISSVAANTSDHCIKTTKDDMAEDKSKVTYSIGERCLARWRDNRRFVATITKELENGEYGIVFDDGFQWKCSTSRLYKYKKSSKMSDLTVDTTMSPSTSSPSPVLSGIGPSTGTTVLNPPFHTHLFDPTRDYLGSKTERREMKRKLNIKEIFNIGQKKKRTSTTPPVRRAPIIREIKRKRKRGKGRIKLEPVETATVNEETKNVPDAVASIIGTVSKSEEVKEDLIEPHELDIKKEPEDMKSPDVTEHLHDDNEIILKKQDVMGVTPEINSTNNSVELNATITGEPASEEESKLEKFDKPDEIKHEEVMDKFKEVINKLEVGLNEIEKIDSPKVEIKCPTPEPIVEELIEEEKPVSRGASPVETVDAGASTVSKKEIKEEETEKPKKKLSKIKKTKKLRLLQEKKVKRQVEKVKSELEEMKRQVEEMKKQMMMKTEELSKQTPQEMPENFLLPGEWCCKWLNGQPVGTVCELETEVKDANNKPALPRRSVQVEDKRLPPGWTKHMVRRSFGQSAGKWDVVLIGPDNHRFHTKTDMRNYLELHPEQNLRSYEHALLDFGVHLKLSRRMGWFKTTSGEVAQPTGVIDSLSPLVKRKSLSLKRKGPLKEKKKLMKFSKRKFLQAPEEIPNDLFNTSENANDMSYDQPTLEDGYVYVGSLKVQIIENLLRCPAEGCFKNFRNNTLLKMHIKHYHRELRKLLGVTPKVLDLAYARSKTKPTDKRPAKARRDPNSKIIKVKIPRIHKRVDEPKLVVPPESSVESTIPAVPKIERIIPRSQDSPKLRQALANSNKPVKRPKVLLPVRKPDPPDIVSEMEEPPLVDFEDVDMDNPEIPMPLDFEAAISTHTVTKPLDDKKRAESKKLKKSMSETEEWLAVNSDFETRSSFPGSGTPDSKSRHENDKLLSNNPGVSSESNEDKEVDMYMYTETGERIKIEHMKREEIINCHCGFREEDGLMVQCELCLCWQHALCHNIHTESQVPEKYTCSICLNPKRGRRSKRFLHDQDRMYEGLLPGGRPADTLRRSHELSGNLLRIRDALHALRVKYHVATTRNHPKLYLWAKDWENTEININSDYSDLNIIINNIGKENLPVRTDDLRDLNIDARPPPDDDNRDSQLMSLATALSSPGGTSLDLPISTSELERLARSVQEQASGSGAGPQPEAAIESGACRERLLRHVRRCQALVDASLDSIEAQVAELESQDPSFEDDETADYFPRTKQTMQMLMRDLETMEELGTIT